MKFRTTQKAVKENYSKVYSVGYCGFQNLLAYEAPAAYTCGVYGWNADVYNVGGGVAISTGYRPFGASLDSDVINDLDSRAAAIRDNNSLDYSQKHDAIKAIISDYFLNN